MAVSKLFFFALEGAETYEGVVKRLKQLWRL